MPLRLLAALLFLIFAPDLAAAQDVRPPSKCMAIAEALPSVTYANFTPAAGAGEGERGPVESTSAAHDEEREDRRGLRLCRVRHVDEVRRHTPAPPVGDDGE